MTASPSPAAWLFPAKFLVLLVAVAVVFELGVDVIVPILNALALSTAQICGALLEFAGSAVTRRDVVLTLDGFSVQVIGGCTGALEFTILTAFILAFPASWRQRLIGIAAGGLAIYVFNLIRIMSLLVIGSMSEEVFSFFHLYFWQVTAIGMIGSIGLVWAKSIEPRAA